MIDSHDYLEKNPVTYPSNYTAPLYYDMKR